jgi:hypothetical protein
MDGGAETEIAERLRAVERLTQLFRLERLVYLSFAIAAFAMLVACLVVALFRHENMTGILGAFGSSGIVAFTSARVIVMWSRALAIVVPLRA